MTPASFARLGLRLMGVYHLVLVLPAQVYICLFSAITFSRSAGPLDVEAGAGLVAMWAQAGVTFALGLTLWFAADAWVRLILPAGANPAAQADYARWERLGLLFVGGLMLLAGIQHLIQWLTDIKAGAWLIAFEIAGGLILILDEQVLVGALTRLLHKPGRAIATGGEE